MFIKFWALCFVPTLSHLIFTWPYKVSIIIPILYTYEETEAWRSSGNLPKASQLLSITAEAGPLYPLIKSPALSHLSPPLWKRWLPSLTVTSSCNCCGTFCPVISIHSHCHWVGKFMCIRSWRLCNVWAFMTVSWTPFIFINGRRARIQ